jgi:hypothetical protein
MILTARACGVGFHAGKLCAGITMLGWPTYLSAVEGPELQLDAADLGSDPVGAQLRAAEPVAAAAVARQLPDTRKAFRFLSTNPGAKHLSESTA